jgi:hypothetical protein
MRGIERLVTAWRRVRNWVQGIDAHERTRETMGALLARQVAQVRHPASLADVEFRVHSQFGDDGIIQWLVARLPTLPKLFVEFGVEDYTEANTRFLMVNNAWRGLVMDGSRENIRRLRSRGWFWRHDITATSRFLTRENVDESINDWAKGRDVGLMHIDVDGNDYWLWNAVHCITPGIVIMEYNAVFGPKRPITIPYQADFRRFVAHRSGLYFGASLPALAHLADTKGYALVGVNSAGNNAYFVRRDLLDECIRAVDASDTFVMSKFRESRDDHGRLDYLDVETRQARIRGLPVVDVRSMQHELF